MICNYILNLGMCNLYCIWMPDYFHSLKPDLLSVSGATALHQVPKEARFFEPWFAAHPVSIHHVKQNQAETRKLGAVNCLVRTDRRNKETRAALVVYDSFYTQRKPERPHLHTEKHKQINVHFGLSTIIHFTVFADWDQFLTWLLCGHRFFFFLLSLTDVLLPVFPSF